MCMLKGVSNLGDSVDNLLLFTESCRVECLKNSKRNTIAHLNRHITVAKPCSQIEEQLDFFRVKLS